MSLGENQATHANGGPSDGSQTPAVTAPPNGEDASAKQVQEVLSSEIGVLTMLVRLKQSIASAKEFGLFLKKRSMLEDEHANGLKKLCKMSQDSLQRTEHLGGSFSKAYNEMMFVHERMADNGMQFAGALLQMHEDLLELAAVAEKSRKGWKQTGLLAEQRVADLESAMRKSKAKYDALADEYDRVRTGDGGKSGKMFGFKGPKSAAQHEEDLLRKVQGQDQDYKAKVETVRTERGELLTKTRPETVKALQDITKECDSGLTMQLQKFASFNEKLLLSNGLSISPLKPGPGEARSLRESILAVDNEKDLNDFILGHMSKMPPRQNEPTYERNSVLDQPQRSQLLPALSLQTPATFSGRTGAVGFEKPDSPGVTSPASPRGHGYGHNAGCPMGASQPQHERSSSYGSMQTHPSTQQQAAPRNSLQPSSQSPAASSHPSQGPASRYGSRPMSSSNSVQGPPQLGELSFQSPQPPTSNQASYSAPKQQSGPGSKSSQQPPSQAAMRPAQQGMGPGPQSTANVPSRSVFGVSLSRLYDRDGLAVPMVVYQCIQAVDLYGLSVEGIYRLSGSVPAVNKLKHMFDTDSSSSNLDFRNPENFGHDVNSVAGLLKQFLRDLPDPLLPREHYSGFIEAAKHEDETLRRDSLHAIINSLPDPNYATLRALMLHLYRVMDNASVTRMSTQNLAIVFGPTLMGPQSGAEMTEAGWQVRVVETILNNTYQIFDDD